MQSHTPTPSPNRSWNLSLKPDFDECLARIYAWYEQKVLDRPPVRFHHHNMEYERHRTVAGPWKNATERWFDVEFQMTAFVESLSAAPFLGETFPVFWPNLSAVVYNLFLGQDAWFDDVTAWTHPCVDDLDHLPDLRVKWDSEYFRTVEAPPGKTGYFCMYYGLKVKHTGPVFQRADFKHGKVTLHFDHVGAGLMVGKKVGTEPAAEVPHGQVQEFAIAGPDKRFYAADAVITGDTVVVSSDQVPQPAAVRYACTFNPAGNKLYGRSGLPAAPFRTDNW